MPRYSFDTPVNRFDSNCVKYDEMPSREVIPLWVADMDLETAPVVIDALRKRLQHGCFGYTHVPDSYYASVISWFERRHSLHLQREWFIYTSGVVPAISATIKACTQPGDAVLVLAPVYNCFYSSIRNNGCKVLESALRNVDGRYEIDFEDLRRKCSLSSTKVLLLCNPHNPTGRVWTREELYEIGEICRQNDVLVLDDGIHCEFVRTPYRYTAFMSASTSPCVTFLSPSKSFNTAGLQIANIICPDEELRHRIDRAININEVCDVNPFGVVALQAAYSAEGEEWLDQLLDYIYDNCTFVEQYLGEHHPQWHVTKLQGTYLLWVDISATGMKAQEFSDYLLDEAKVYVNPGNMYCAEAKLGENYIRINLATQRSRLAEALQRITKVVNEL